RPKNDQEKALAAWLWRNTHYAHGEEGAEDLWGQGFTKGMDLRTREYWTGMFAHGFGLCGTTHSQWTAEMEHLLGHNRGRGVGVTGHNSFEVFLTGGAYGKGKWCLLDHDISTVIFDAKGDSLLSLAEVQKDWKRLTQRDFNPQKQHGWLVCGLHPGDGASYDSYQVAEYLSGYSGPPPMVHLRRGESLRRYLQPGLEDGKTFVFWGRNYNAGGIPGPERSQTWVNQPEKMHGSQDGTGYKAGQARYGNAVYTYRPNFKDGTYREGVISEDEDQVTFEFYSPYIIGATPPHETAWGVYQPACTNGLIIQRDGVYSVSVSADQGATWQEAGALRGDVDLTDIVKGRRQYFLRINRSAKVLAESSLTVTTVCQCNAAILPRLKDEGTEIRFAASHQAVVSAGPNLPQAQAHVVEGKFGSPKVTLELQTPRGEDAVSLYAAAHMQSSNPPSADVKYSIDYSLDGGKTWQPVVKDWQITRRGDEPADFWSQSFCWGNTKIAQLGGKPVRVRFRNDGGKNIARAEAHLVYRTRGRDLTRLTFAWKDAGGEHSDFRVLGGKEDLPSAVWHLPTGKETVTRWVGLEPEPAP
ncbi:MAG: hypothetical protein IAF94_26520, partial [Pirellulaceae bacterium]|nr:hypothetical protein [Pirellulaceae bacterium]